MKAQLNNKDIPKKQPDFLQKAIEISSISVWVVGFIYISYRYWSFTITNAPTPFIIFVAAIIYTVLFSLFAKSSVWLAFFIGIFIGAFADIIYKIIGWLTKKFGK